MAVGRGNAIAGQAIVIDRADEVRIGHIFVGWVKSLLRIGNKAGIDMIKLNAWDGIAKQSARIDIMGIQIIQIRRHPRKRRSNRARPGLGKRESFAVK